MIELIQCRFLLSDHCVDLGEVLQPIGTTVCLFGDRHDFYRCLRLSDRFLLPAEPREGDSQGAMISRILGGFANARLEQAPGFVVKAERLLGLSQK